MPLVAGVDSSTQACKVVVRDAETGRWSARDRAASRTAPRSTRSVVARAADAAIDAAGGLDDVAAIAVGGQQHGMVCLDEDGRSSGRRCCGTTPGRPAPPPSWSPSSAARRLGPTRSGCVPVASFTVTKLRWLAEHEPGNADANGGGVPAARLADLATRGSTRLRR